MACALGCRAWQRRTRERSTRAQPQGERRRRPAARQAQRRGGGIPNGARNDSHAAEESTHKSASGSSGNE